MSTLVGGPSLPEDIEALLREELEAPQAPSAPHSSDTYSPRANKPAFVQMSSYLHGQGTTLSPAQSSDTARYSEDDFEDEEGSFGVLSPMSNLSQPEGKSPARNGFGGSPREHQGSYEEGEEQQQQEHRGDSFPPAEDPFPIQEWSDTDPTLDAFFAPDPVATGRSRASPPKAREVHTQSHLWEREPEGDVSGVPPLEGDEDSGMDVEGQSGAGLDHVSEGVSVDRIGTSFGSRRRMIVDGGEDALEDAGALVEEEVAPPEPKYSLEGMEPVKYTAEDQELDYLSSEDDFEVEEEEAAVRDEEVSGLPENLSLAPTMEQEGSEVLALTSQREAPPAPAGKEGSVVSVKPLVVPSLHLPQAREEMLCDGGDPDREMPQSRAVEVDRDTTPEAGEVAPGKSLDPSSQHRVTPQAEEAIEESAPVATGGSVKSLVPPLQLNMHSLRVEHGGGDQIAPFRQSSSNNDAPGDFSVSPRVRSSSPSRQRALAQGGDAMLGQQSSLSGAPPPPTSSPGSPGALSGHRGSSPRGKVPVSEVVQSSSEGTTSPRGVPVAAPVGGDGRSSSTAAQEPPQSSSPRQPRTEGSSPRSRPQPQRQPTCSPPRAAGSTSQRPAKVEDGEPQWNYNTRRTPSPFVPSIFSESQLRRMQQDSPDNDTSTGGYRGPESGRTSGRISPKELVKHVRQGVIKTGRVAHFVNTPEVASERLLQLSQQRSEDLLLLRHLISRHDLSKADRKSIVNHLEQRETERSGKESFLFEVIQKSRTWTTAYGRRSLMTSEWTTADELLAFQEIADEERLYETRKYPYNGDSLLVMMAVEGEVSDSRALSQAWQRMQGEKCASKLGAEEFHEQEQCRQGTAQEYPPPPPVSGRSGFRRSTPRASTAQSLPGGGPTSSHGRLRTPRTSRESQRKYKTLSNVYLQPMHFVETPRTVDSGRSGTTASTQRSSVNASHEDHESKKTEADRPPSSARRTPTAVMAGHDTYPGVSVTPRNNPHMRNPIARPMDRKNPRKPPQAMKMHQVGSRLRSMRAGEGIRKTSADPFDAGSNNSEAFLPSGNADGSHASFVSQQTPASMLITYLERGKDHFELQLSRFAAGGPEPRVVIPPDVSER